MLDVNSLEVELLEYVGYIYKRKENVIIIPGRKTVSTIVKRIFDYDFTILNDIDPLVQINLLCRGQEAILFRTLKRFNGLKFNTSIEIKMFKQATDKYENKFFFTKMNTITSKDQISSAIIAMTEQIYEKTSHCTEDGSERPHRSFRGC